MAWNVDFPASFFFFLIIIDLGTNWMRKKHSKWILLPVNFLCYDHIVIAGLLAGMSLFCCWARCPGGPSSGRRSAGFKGKRAVFENVIFKKIKKVSSHLLFKGSFSFWKDLCFLLNWIGETSETVNQFYSLSSFSSIVRQHPNTVFFSQDSSEMVAFQNFWISLKYQQ